MNDVQQRPSRFGRLQFLLKNGLFRSRRTGPPAKESMLLEGLVLAAAVLVGGAIVVLVVVVLLHR